MSDQAPDPGQEAADRISELPARMPADPAALIAVLGPVQILEEAELAARGICPVSVVHGVVESADDEMLVFIMLPSSPGRPGNSPRSAAGSTTQPGSSQARAPGGQPACSSEA